MPEVAVIGRDGGRMRTRASGQGTGVHGQGGKEDTVACLQTRKGVPFHADPHPQPPPCFVDAPLVDNRVRDLQAHHGARQEKELPQWEEGALDKATTPASPTPPRPEETTAAAEPAWPPQRTENSRTCVATMQDCQAFGKMVAAEA